MALINCPECGKQISDKAPACPNCGYPMELCSKEPEKEPSQKTTSNRCPNCGKDVPFYQAKCPECGTKVNTELPVSGTMKTWKVGKEKIEVQCQCCGKIFLYNKKWFYPANDPRGQIPSTLLRCPGCGTESPAGERLPNEGVVEYESFNPEEPPKQKGIPIEQKYGIKTTFQQGSTFIQKSPTKTQEPSFQGARCPHYGSTSIQAVKKGFGLGKAAAGGILLGPIGLLGGAIGSNKIQRVCLNCGRKF